MAMSRLQVSMPQETIDRLELASDGLGISKSALIILAVISYLPEVEAEIREMKGEDEDER